MYSGEEIFTQWVDSDEPRQLDPAADTEDLRLAIHCRDESRLGQLAIKLEEYVRRTQISPNAAVVRNAICKMAVIDLLVREEGVAEYMDAYEYAMEGATMYGMDLLVQNGDEHASFLQEFDNAFHTIRSYVETGNMNVTGGTQLPDLS